MADSIPSTVRALAERSDCFTFVQHCSMGLKSGEYGSRLVMAGVDLRTVQELMGHKTIAMTCRYAHLAPAHLREAVDRLTLRPTDTKKIGRASCRERVYVLV